jgi:hypothetical protein
MLKPAKDELPTALRARKEALHRFARERRVGPEPKKKGVEDE